VSQGRVWIKLVDEQSTSSDPSRSSTTAHRIPAPTCLCGLSPPDSSQFTNCQLITDSSPLIALPPPNTSSLKSIIPYPTPLVQPPNLCIELIPPSHFDTPDPEATPMSIAQHTPPPPPTFPPPSIDQNERVAINCVEGEGISLVGWDDLC
jgi:hypothetical protein